MDSVSENIVTLYCCMLPGCAKNYSTKFNLRRHVTVYHLKKTHNQCQLCQKWLASKQNLQEHMRMHSGEKPFSCSKCEMKFRFASQLSLHKRKCQYQDTDDLELKIA
ncbi:unnamed protein product [Blepharisma stoltei]|uniref:C2H2-type domain-containing protein n=1 Tax=Blepharisma stoltei TaxID=1481888 RepID=A0AAU9J594_9CILI|nr:unnamed protein product [Blepharisma stoltei]